MEPNGASNRGESSDDDYCLLKDWGTSRQQRGGARSGSAAHGKRATRRRIKSAGGASCLATQADTAAWTTPGLAFAWPRSCTSSSRTDCAASGAAAARAAGAAFGAVGAAAGAAAAAQGAVWDAVAGAGATTGAEGGGEGGEGQQNHAGADMPGMASYPPYEGTGGPAYDLAPLDEQVRRIQLTVPEGAKAGTFLRFQDPVTGQTREVCVPPGCAPGAILEVQPGGSAGSPAPRSCPEEDLPGQIRQAAQSAFAPLAAARRGGLPAGQFSETCGEWRSAPGSPPWPHQPMRTGGERLPSQEEIGWEDTSPQMSRLSRSAGGGVMRMRACAVSMAHVWPARHVRWVHAMAE